MQLLIAPAAFKGTLRASEVAAAIGRGIEAGGLEPPDLCPVADGGEGTIDVLLGRLGGETASARVADAQGRPVDVGFALLGGGSTALVEAARVCGCPAGTRADGPAAAGTRGVGELILAAAAAGAGAGVVLVAAGGAPAIDGGAGAAAAIAEAGGLGGARVVVLCDVRTPYESAVADPRSAEGLPRDPRGVPYAGAGGGLAGALWAALGAELRPGAQFVLEALDFDRRMRAAWAVVAGEGHLDRSTVDGKVAGEVATRARQAGVPAHAIVGASTLDRFDARILDLQEILVASTRAEIVAAGRALAERLGPANH